MAEEERKILIDVEVVGNEEEIGKINNELRQNREQIKELSKDYETNATEIAKLEVANKKLSASKNVLVNQTKAEGNSLDALRARLASLTKERNSLDTSIEGNAKRFADLQKEIKSTSDEIKGFEQAGGDFRRNVGNYTESIKEAIGQQQVFGVSLNQLGTEFSNTVGAIAGTNTAVQGTTKAFRILKVAIAATGIGLLIVALGSLVTYLKRTQEGQEIVNRLMRQLGAVVDVILDRVAMLGKAVVQIFKGDFVGAAETAKSAFRGIGDEIREEVKLARILADGLADIEKREAAIVLSNAEKLKQIKELNKIAEDTSRSAQERLNAAGRAIEIEQSRLDALLQIQKDKVALLEQEYDRSESTTADLLALNQERARLFELETSSLEAQTTLQNKLNILQTQLIKQRQDELKGFFELSFEKEGKSQKEIEKLRIADLKSARDAIKKKQNIEESARVARIMGEKMAQQQILNAGGDILASLASENKAFAIASVAFDQGRALASALANANSPTPDNVASGGLAGIAKYATIAASIFSTVGRIRQIINSGQSSSSGGFIGTGGGTTGNSRTQSLGIVQPQLLQQFSQPIQNQVGLESASGRVNLPPIYVNVTDINKVNAGVRAKVTESRL
jgi:hypothetical protein